MVLPIPHKSSLPSGFVEQAETEKGQANKTGREDAKNKCMLAGYKGTGKDLKIAGQTKAWRKQE